MNGRGLDFRCKSERRALDELDRVTSRYKITQFGLTDCIINMRYWKTLFPELARRGAPYRMFFEIKFNLSREHMRVLSEAGAVWLQPGIEGLHDDILRLMNKGVTALENVQALKFAREYGVRMAWHLLVGFPDESDEWHIEMARILPRLYHLQPIQGVLNIRFDRFSAYQAHPERYGLEIEPFPACSAIYPIDETAVREIAYYFRSVVAGSSHHPDARVSPGIEALRVCEKEWTSAWNRPMPVLLCMEDKPDGIDIYDTRPCAPHRRVMLTGLDAELYRRIESVTDEHDLVEQLAEKGYSEEAVLSSLDRLDKSLLVLRLSGTALALAVPGANPSLPSRNKVPFGSVPMANAGRMVKFFHDKPRAVRSLSR